MFKCLKYICTWGMILLFIIAFAISMFKLERFLNYKISYGKKVEQTIREMVKPEALK